MCIYIYIPFKPTYNQDTVKKKTGLFLIHEQTVVRDMTKSVT